MEKMKHFLGSWIEPAIIIVVILYVMDIQIDSLKSELSLFREDVNRTFQRYDSVIQHNDQKIDHLKDSLISSK